MPPDLYVTAVWIKTGASQLAIEHCLRRLPRTWVLTPKSMFAHVLYDPIAWEPERHAEIREKVLAALDASGLPYTLAIGTHVVLARGFADERCG